jgi:glycosyltransferase involved in cell wall biosynthesis
MRDLSGLRILAFCDYFSPDSSGGAERVASEVYGRLAEAGAIVRLLTTTSSREPASFETAGITVRAVPALDLRRLAGGQVSIAPMVIRESIRQRNAFQPTVLHANGLHFQTSAAGAFLQRRTSMPMVSTMHLARAEHLPAGLRAATSIYERSVGRFILRSSSAVIAVSRSVAHHALRLGVPRERIHVVPNGVDHRRFHPAGEAAEPRRRPLVLVVGRLISNKGPQVAIQALRNLPNGSADVVFIGEGPLRKKLERVVDQSGLRDRVRFEGHSKDVDGWLRRADVLVRPSFTEGLPLTVLEAMASGVCVIASDIPGNTDLVRHGETGLLFPVGDACSLAARLRRVLSDQDERRRLAERGWRAAQAFSWDACAESTATILSETGARWSDS